MIKIFDRSAFAQKFGIGNYGEIFTGPFARSFGNNFCDRLGRARKHRRTDGNHVASVFGFQRQANLLGHVADGAQIQMAMSG